MKLHIIIVRAKVEDTTIEDAANALGSDDGERGGSSESLVSEAAEAYEALIEKFCTNEASSMTYISVWIHYLNFLTEESCTR